tara:strand:+ start:189 stop:1121 length:933 start_codon:yes stop_codon:yes gene_type:complete
VSKSILITGVAGFLGSHLCDLFLNEKFKVFGIDNLITGKKSNINHHNYNSKFKFINQDVCNEITIKEKIDYILHFASPASPFDYLKYPIETLRTGSLGTENILKFAKKNKSIVLVASTSEIYGDPIQHPQTELYFGNVNPIGPRGVYDEAKRYLEAISSAYIRKEKIDIKIARIFNTYGPRMRKNDGRAIPTFINQSLNKNNYTVFGNGNQTRSFCHVKDTILGIKKLLFSNYNKPVNIGNPEEYNILELIKLIDNIVGYKTKINFKSLPENDPKKRKPCIKLAKKILNWEPKVTLREGLVSTINFYKNA